MSILPPSSTAESSDHDPRMQAKRMIEGRLAKQLEEMRQAGCKNDIAQWRFRLDRLLRRSRLHRVRAGVLQLIAERELVLPDDWNVLSDSQRRAALAYRWNVATDELLRLVVQWNENDEFTLRSRYELKRRTQEMFNVLFGYHRLPRKMGMEKELRFARRFMIQTLLRPEELSENGKIKERSGHQQEVRRNGGVLLKGQNVVYNSNEMTTDPKQPSTFESVGFTEHAPLHEGIHNVGVHVMPANEISTVDAGQAISVQTQVSEILSGTAEQASQLVGSQVAPSESGQVTSSNSIVHTTTHNVVVVTSDERQSKHLDADARADEMPKGYREKKEADAFTTLKDAVSRATDDRISSDQRERERMAAKHDLRALLDNARTLIGKDYPASTNSKEFRTDKMLLRRLVKDVQNALQKLQNFPEETTLSETATSILETIQEHDMELDLLMNRAVVREALLDLGVLPSAGSKPSAAEDTTTEPESREPIAEEGYEYDGFRSIVDEARAALEAFYSIHRDAETVNNYLGRLRIIRLDLSEAIRRAERKHATSFQYQRARQCLREIELVYPQVQNLLRRLRRKVWRKDMKKEAKMRRKAESGEEPSREKVSSVTSPSTAGSSSARFSAPSATAPSSVVPSTSPASIAPSSSPAPSKPTKPKSSRFRFEMHDLSEIGDGFRPDTLRGGLFQRFFPAKKRTSPTSGSTESSAKVSPDAPKESEPKTKADAPPKK